MGLLIDHFDLGQNAICLAGTHSLSDQLGGHWYWRLDHAALRDRDALLSVLAAVHAQHGFTLLDIDFRSQLLDLFCNDELKR